MYILCTNSRIKGTRIANKFESSIGLLNVGGVFSISSTSGVELAIVDIPMKNRLQVLTYNHIMHGLRAHIKVT